MANQVFVNPFPYGVDNTQRSLLVKGSIALAGSAVTAGEPINWTKVITGVGYNLINFAGNGANGNGNALVTGLAANAGVITVTAANNFVVGQPVTFMSCTTAFGIKLNGLTFPVASVTPGTSFTIASAITDTTTTAEVGLVVSGNKFMPLSCSGPTITAPVTSLAVTSTSGGVPAFITVTAANKYLPGASVTFSGLSTALGLKMNGVQFSVVSSTSTAFIVYSTLTGSAGADTGTATGNNCPQPYLFRAWSSLASGYTYQYNMTTGGLFVMTSAGFTPAGTNSAPTITTGTNATVTAVVATNGGALTQASGATGITGVQAPVFTGSAVAAGALAALAAAAYPAGVLADVISYEAMFAKQV